MVVVEGRWNAALQHFVIGGNALNRKRKILAGALTAALLLTLSIPAFATSGDVAGAVEQTWTSAQGQIKTVVNNVVFPVLDVILAVLFFVKVGASYFECAPVEVA